MRGPDAANRSALFLVGLLLLVCGVLGLLVGYSVIGVGYVEDRVVPAAWSDYAHTHAWVWWAALAACLVLAFVGLRWLLAQLRSDRISRVELGGDSRQGRTTLYAGALAEAVQAHASMVRGVGAASAHLTSGSGGIGAERLHVVADLTEYADLAAVRTSLSTGVVADARQALGRPALPVHIQLRVGQVRSRGRDLQ